MNKLSTLLVSCSLLFTVANAYELPKLTLDTSTITVSGVSSGGYMAGQFHIANSDKVKGVGIIAGGPYYCAYNSLMTALGGCVNKQSAPTDLAKINKQLAQFQQNNKIPPLDNLKDSKVWLFHGTKDEKVLAAVANDLTKQYQQWLANDHIKYVNDQPFAHHFPTLDAGSQCDESVAPFLGNCNYDAAGEILNFVLANVKPAAKKASGDIIEISQKAIFDVDAAGMADTGYAYVPKQCSTDATCQVHISFHGCNQYVEADGVGMAYVKRSGINRWADSNNLVVLYPQTKKSMMSPFNPQGCWDWWGYTGEDYATKDGLQISGINKIIRYLAKR